MNVGKRGLGLSVGTRGARRAAAAPGW